MNEPTPINKVNGTKLIDSQPKEVYVFVFNDGSSNKTFEDEGAGINFTFPPDNPTKHFIVRSGKIASNYTCELLEIQTALNKYYIKPSEKERSKWLIIFRDCKDALQAIHKSYLGLITNIHYTFRQLTSLKAMHHAKYPSTC
ncbi:hypothetical protein TNCT_572991 [Trichonephila clavata]|uniref:RNase H type-1 domain-containing protein n=1 Tax=Trichonephila clavata TaxID=2740835 RepID=A0A8X6G7A4_TRICU|nr:hypothetical protein TNCT_572991 [Trichonephila clavata]